MNNFYDAPCPNCKHIEKKIVMDGEGKFYVICSNCKYQSPHFEFVLQAEANWIVGGHSDFTVSV